MTVEVSRAGEAASGGDGERADSCMEAGIPLSLCLSMKARSNLRAGCPRLPPREERHLIREGGGVCSSASLRAVDGEQEEQELPEFTAGGFGGRSRAFVCTGGEGGVVRELQLHQHMRS